MITYELAKLLKEAGFPKHSLCNNECTTEGDVGVDMCYPSLSELIEACGEDFFSLHRHVNKLTHKNGEVHWYVISEISSPQGKRKILPHNGVFRSKSPEECIASLWLALNKK